MRHPEARVSVRYVVYLLLLICVQILLCWVEPLADPSPSYFTRHAFLEESGARLAAAASWLGGEPVAAAWQRPLASLPQAASFAIYGVSLASARALGTLAALVLIVLVAEVLRRRCGSAVALFGALLMAVEPAWLALIRSPSGVPWAALGLLSVMLLANRGARAWTLAAFLTPLLAWILDPLIALAAPALLGGLMAHFPVSRASRCAAGIAVGVLLALTGPCLWSLLGPAPLPPIEALLSYEERTRVPGAIPLLLALAACGSCLRVAHGLSVAPGFGALHVLVWTGLGWLGLSEGASLDSALVLLPALVLLAGESLAFALHRPLLPRPVWRPGPILALIGAGVLGCLWIVVQVGIAVRLETLPATRWAALAGGICVLLAHGLPVTATRLRARWLVPLACLLLMAAALPRVRALLGEADHSVLRAARQLDGMLLPTSLCTGSWAEILAVAGGHGGWARGSARTADPTRASGATHLLAVHARGGLPAELLRYQAAGIGLEPVEILQVRDFPVHLYRLGGARIPLSLFEEAVRASAHGLHDEAEGRWLFLTSVRPDLAPAWGRLGTSLLVRWRARSAPTTLVGVLGAPPVGAALTVAAVGLSELRRRSFEPLAFTCLMTAVQHDPDRVEARLALADLYLARGLRREARHHLEAALAAEPAHAQLRGWLELLATDAHRR